MVWDNDYHTSHPQGFILPTEYYTLSISMKKTNTSIAFISGNKIYPKDVLQKVDFYLQGIIIPKRGEFTQGIQIRT